MTTPYKGEALGGGRCPLTRLPLNPSRLHPRLLLERSAKPEVCLRQTSLLEGTTSYEFSYIRTIILIIKALKIANSLRSNTAIFLTGFSIRILVLVLRDIVSRHILCFGSFGFAKHCYILWTHLVYVLLWFLYIVDLINIARGFSTTLEAGVFLL